jgi:hypothetical protein
MHVTTKLMIAGIVLSIASPAVAQTTQGALQIGLGTDFVSHSSWQGEWERPDQRLDSERKSTRWGIAQNNVIYVEGGYGVGDSMIVGGLLSLGGWNRSTRENTVVLDENHASGFELMLAPKFDYIFLPDSRVRPFIGAAIGIVHHSEAVEHTNNQGIRTTRDDLSLTGLWLMGRAGIRAFLTPAFSVDPALFFGWVPVADGSRQMPEAGPNPSRRFDFSADGYTVGLSVTASGWIGL